MANKKTLAAKLAEITASVGKINKTGYNDFQKYTYVTEADILEVIRGEIASRNIFVSSSVIGSSYQDNLTTVNVRFTFHDGDSEETLEVQSMGQGHDKGDKGIYKAITGASKYMLLKNFLLPTGDDAEAPNAVDKSSNKKASTTTGQVKRGSSTVKAKATARPSGFGS